MNELGRVVPRGQRLLDTRFRKSKTIHQRHRQVGGEIAGVFAAGSRLQIFAMDSSAMSWNTRGRQQPCDSYRTLTTRNPRRRICI